MFRCQLLLVCVVGLLATPRSATIAQVDPATKDKPVPEPKLVANKGKPLTSHGRSALDFLVKQQQANGGWNSGPSAAAMEGMALSGRWRQTAQRSPRPAKTPILSTSLIPASLHWRDARWLHAEIGCSFRGPAQGDCRRPQVGRGFRQEDPVGNRTHGNPGSRRSATTPIPIWRPSCWPRHAAKCPMRGARPDSTEVCIRSSKR